MTIRKQWLLILLLVSIIAIIINAGLLSLLIDQYFTDYITENYEQHVEEIIEYASNTMSIENFSVKQMNVELQTRLDDPITEIKIYDASDNLIIHVYNESQMMGKGNRRMNNGMGHMMRNRSNIVDDHPIHQNGMVIGRVLITRNGSIEDSIASQMFKASILKNSLISSIVVFLMAIGIGLIVSKRMSRELIETAKQAQNIDLGNEEIIVDSSVREIQTIKQSLRTLGYRLKLKQKSRKKLIDSLVHQTRTPLTILQSYIESVQDDIIEMDKEELKTCENQIDNLTSIISNMSQLIEAEEDIEPLNIEEFDICKELEQIVNGLKPQFNKKNIQLNHTNCQKIMIKTDKYKLKQAVYNIITNAYKYTGNGGTVNIEVKQVDDRLSIIIQDTGAGISENEIKKIFDAYYRGHNAAQTPGEGLGLYIVQKNIKEIEGNIDVRSEAGKGSQFTIEIPLKYL
ncbi:MAG: HAMP domain-containing histidine kinase [Clostridia bacterium]|nr:HAMP domain-containing histidine kinase [Clostridia bacterium]